MSLYLTISANFRIGTTLPPIEDHYNDLWKLALFLETVGLPLDGWCPPADTPVNARLNAAFDVTGPSAAALAMAKADKDNLASDMRALGVWNGEEDDGGMAYTATYNLGRIPSDLRLSAEDIAAFQDYSNVVRLVQSIIHIWKPLLVKVAPGGYNEHRVFPDRPAVGWMIYLPFEVTAKQVPEAAKIISVMDGQQKSHQGTIIVTTTDTFDMNNPEHIKKANSIETRLVDQDLLPTLREFVTKF